MRDLKRFRSRAAAEAAGHIVNTNFYPWRTMKGNGADPYRPHGHEVRTDLEAQLAEALEAVEWEGRNLYGIRVCPTCRTVRDYGDAPEHADGCKLSLALKAFKGDPAASPGNRG